MSESTTIVIYGASGDLNNRKLMPALFNLFLKDRLRPNTNIVGLGRTEWNDEEFRQNMQEGLKEFAPKAYKETTWEKFSSHLYYVAGDFTKVEDYVKLHNKLNEVEEDILATNRLYYLAMPPRFYDSIIKALGDTGLTAETEDSGWRRIIIEKPFGHNLKSAQELNKSIHYHLQEHQIYRIDHYLAKETVQNIMVFRFGNSIFEPLWNRNYIDHVQITAIETVDVGKRASYYDSSGVLRDMFQNHLMQLLSIVTMEPPASRQANSLRNEKVKALAAVRKYQSAGDVANNAIRAQYDSYRQAEGVKEKSLTPTFAVMRLYLDNWRWQGVPFYLRSGKALADKLTEITIQFKPAPHMLFAQKRQVPGNTLTLTIQPDESIHLRFEAKVPDTAADLQPVQMHFHYDAAFQNNSIPEAYERLLYDALNGDASLFTRDDEVELAWRIIDPVLEAWESNDAQPLYIYETGSWGPVEADEFLAADGRAWLNGAEHEQIVMP